MINSSYFLLNVVLLGIGTIIIRGSFIFFAGNLRLTPSLKKLFTFIPAAIFPALVVPAAYFHQGSVAMAYGKERLLVLLLSAVFCFYVRNMLAVIVLGLIALFALRTLA